MPIFPDNKNDKHTNGNTNDEKVISDNTQRLPNDACVNHESMSKSVVSCDDTESSEELSDGIKPATSDKKVTINEVPTVLNHEEVSEFESTDSDGTEQSEEIGEVVMAENDDMATFPMKCPNCHSTQEMKLLRTCGPVSRDFLLMSLKCNDCGNLEVDMTPAWDIGLTGVKMSISIESMSDLFRIVNICSYAEFSIPEVELECEPLYKQSASRLATNPCYVGSLEGKLQELFEDSKKELEYITSNFEAYIEAFGSEESAINAKEVYTEIVSWFDSIFVSQDFKPFTIVIDDPAGQSAVELYKSRGNVLPENKELIEGVGAGDSLEVDKVRIERYVRTKEQSELVGILNYNAYLESIGKPNDEFDHIQNGLCGSQMIKEEVLEFGGTCPNCNDPCPTKMHQVNIPHFKDIIIMATTCEKCGYKDSEIKSGGEIPTTAQRTTLHMKNEKDLRRLFIKSNTCAVTIKDLDLGITPGTMGAKFTTIEGFLRDFADNLPVEHSFSGDSAVGDAVDLKSAQNALLEIADKGGELTIVIEDPLSCSYIEPYEDDGDNIVIEEYPRTKEEDELLGLDNFSEGVQEQA